MPVDFPVGAGGGRVHTKREFPAIHGCLHGGNLHAERQLAFKGIAPAKSEERAKAVEEPSGAGAHRRVDPLGQHGVQGGGFRRGEPHARGEPPARVLAQGAGEGDRDPARIPDGGFTARETEGAQPGKAPGAAGLEQDEFTAPDGAILAAARAIPRDAEDAVGRVAVLQQDGEHMRQMMLHGEARQAGVQGMAR